MVHILYLVPPELWLFEIPGWPSSSVKRAFLILSASFPVLYRQINWPFFMQFKLLWILNPLRTTLMMSLNIIRSLFPAFRGYSQVRLIPHYLMAVVLMDFFYQGFDSWRGAQFIDTTTFNFLQITPINQLQSLIASDNFTWTRLLYLLSTEVFRRIIEGCLDSFA